MNQPARLVLVTAILAHTATGWAAPDDAAAAMKRGTAALKAGRIHEACGAFDEAVKVDAKVENQLSLAACLEQDGKPVTAARLYRSVAAKDTDAKRRTTSTAKADKLEANAPKLRFAINPNPPGLVVTVDGVEVPSTGDLLVDHGPHEVIGTAPGFSGHASAPVDKDRAIVDVILRMEATAQPTPSPTETPAPAPAPAMTPRPEEPTMVPPVAERNVDAPPASHRKRNGVIMAASGVALLVGAGVTYALSSKRFDDEDAACPNKECQNAASLDYALQARSDARKLRGASYGLGVGGVVLLGVGAYFLFTGHEGEPNVAFNLAPGRADVAYTLTF